MTILMTHFSPEDISQKPDEEILALSIDRPALFELLVKKYEKAFLRKAHMLLGRREEAEDAVQETFMKIYLNAARFRSVPGASFQSWGYKILTNTCFTLYKKRKRREEGRVWMSGSEDERHGGHSALENLPDIHFRHAKDEEDIREQALSFLSLLPSNMRRILQMHFLDGLKQKEIAQVEGVTVGAVKIRIFRAKKELQKIYEHDKEK